MNVMSVVSNYIQKVRDELQKLMNNKDAIGPIGRHGTVRRNIFQGFIHTLMDVPNYALNEGDLAGLAKQTNDENIYLHFRLPWRANQHVGMYHLKVRGYSFGAQGGGNNGGKIIDITAVGYVYQPYNDVIAKEMKANGMTAEVYIDANRNAVLMVLIPNVYHTTLVIDSMKVDPGVEIKKGEILCQASKSNRVVFAPAP